MGKKYRQKRAALKLILGNALKQTWRRPVKVVLKLLRTPSSEPPPPELQPYWARLQRVMRGEPEPDPGYRVNELGELRSTIQKLSEHEILNRLRDKAKFEIQREEDENCFRAIDHALQESP